MHFSTSLISRCLTLLISIAPLLSSSAAEPGADKPVILYSRYFNARGESRYLPDGTYQDVLSRLPGEFKVLVHDQPLTRESLAGVNVLLIANASEKAVGTNPPPHHVTATDIEVLAQFVENGGGLIVMGNQENHNLEVENINKLLAGFGLQFTNLYTDVKKLLIPKETPIIGGLCWGYYTGNLVLITPNHPARPRSLVSNDLSQRPLKGIRDEKGSLLAVAQPGRGHVVVVTDSGWISNDALSEKGIGGVAVKGQENWEIFRRLAHWAAGSAARDR